MRHDVRGQARAINSIVEIPLITRPKIALEFRRKGQWRPDKHIIGWRQNFGYLGMTAGITADSWSAELFATNLTNEYAELSNNFVFDRERVTPMRPRTIGIRVGYDF